MITKEQYITDPCGTCATAFWKDAVFAKPGGLRVVHSREYVAESAVNPERYFRLIHTLSDLEESKLPSGYVFREVDLTADCAAVAQLISRCYGFELQPELVRSWADYPVYCEYLWICVVDITTDKPAALGIADFDPTIGEGSLEWIQTLPEHRGRGLSTAVVNELLQRLKDHAAFVTVSGQVDNPTDPESLYRRCGFTGDDIWYVYKEG